jgi:hypothetical protein
MSPAATKRNVVPVVSDAVGRDIRRRFWIPARGQSVVEDETEGVAPWVEVDPEVVPI